MLGITIGDIVGSRFEFDNCRSTEFELFHPACDFTDDTVCATAVADWVLQGSNSNLVPIMQDWCRRYPNPVGAYGERFQSWVQAASPEPYNSWGNGSAMRVAAAGWLYDTLARTREVARQTAVVTHNHAEGIKGAEATASAIFLSREGKPKEEIKEYIVREFGYDLSRTLDEIRPHYSMDATCQGSVPEAILSFLESTDFEDAVRNAVSIGGDTDTVACIAGSIAEAFYGVPEALKAECRRCLPQEMLAVLDAFDEARQR